MSSNLILLQPIQQIACGNVVPLLVGAYVQPITIISPICGFDTSLILEYSDDSVEEYRSGIVTVNRLGDFVSFLISVPK